MYNWTFALPATTTALKWWSILHMCSCICIDLMSDDMQLYPQRWRVSLFYMQLFYHWHFQVPKTGCWVWYQSIFILSPENFRFLSQNCLKKNVCQWSWLKKIVCIQWSSDKKCMRHLKNGTPPPPPPINIKWFVPNTVKFMYFFKVNVMWKIKTLFFVILLQAKNPCALTCRSPDSNKFSLDNVVLDGTKCYNNESHDICLNGKCEVSIIAS